MSFMQTMSGLFVPNKKPVAVACGFCSEFIWQHKEAKGRLYLAGGKPICAKCRILKISKLSKIMLRDYKRYQKDVDDREKFLQSKANADVQSVALESQKANPDSSLSRFK